MQKFFLLIASPSESIDGERINAYEMARRRLDAKEWGLWANTPHKYEIEPGDVLVIYLSGSAGMKFVAKATAKEVTKNPRGYIADDDALTDQPVATLKLQSVEWFKNEVSIRVIKDELAFIPKGTSKWGCVLQRGVKKIHAVDAQLILARSLLADSSDR